MVHLSTGNAQRVPIIYLEEHRHGRDDPLLPQSRVQAVKVVRVVRVDLHLLEKQKFVRSRFCCRHQLQVSIRACFFRQESGSKS